MLGDGAGGFSVATRVPAGLDPLGPRAADLDGEGTVDLVTMSPTNERFRVLLSRCPGEPAPEYCAGDIAGGPGGGSDGNVDTTDLFSLLGGWGPCPGCAGDLAPADDVDGVIDTADLFALLGQWGSPCTP
jgi:hypothetical protein